MFLTELIRCIEGTNRMVDDQPQPVPDTIFGAVVLTSAGEFTTETFDTLDALVTRLIELVDKDVSVSCFAGQPLPISKPPFRHVLTPWGNKPLFVLPSAELEADDTGYLGVDPIHLAGPAQINVRPAAQAQVEDEFFDDDSGSALDIFGGPLPDPEN